MLRAAALAGVLCAAGCSRPESTALGNEPGSSRPSSAVKSAEPRASAPASGATRAHRAPDAPAPLDSEELGRRYAWLKGADGVPEVHDTLDRRFAAPAGFRRVDVEPTSFAAFLRQLPLAAPDTPVRTYRGDVLHPASDARIAGVVAIDVGRADLQQCADAVMRLHAEWLWAKGERTQSYRAAAGTALPYERYRRGERLVPEGATLSWKPMARPSDEYRTFRGYLDAVFAWANTVSLERQARSVTRDELRAGDFFILPGNPGHAVLVLDVAASGAERRALLGQSFMPAQSFQILRPRAGEAWFDLAAERDLRTPFWRPFPWTSLKRLP